MKKIAYTLTTERSSHFHLHDGTMEEAKAIPHSVNHQEITTFGPLTRTANTRPAGYHKLSGRNQWDTDKDLGILDWDGDPSK